jgi:hypothetical protein
MQTLDLKKTYKHLYLPSAKAPELVEVPDLQFLMIDGAIEPGKEPGNSPAFAEAFQAIYGAAYTLKFMLKKRKEDPVDYPVMALEGLWWVEDGQFEISVKDNWSWRLMVMTPEVVTTDLFEAAREQLRQKRPSPGIDRLRLQHFAEGLCVQIMHIGPYAEEPRTVERMKAFAAEQGYALSGMHHEIYLGDPRRAQPEKLKTALRHPVEAVAAAVS